MKKPTDTRNSSDTALWREAIEICESLAGMDRNAVLSKLNDMQLAPKLLEKIQRILENMSTSNPLLDQHDYQSLMNNLKQGNHLIGQNIGGYEIKRLIAKGGMSTVYEANFKEAKHQKSVAIKLLSPYGITEKAIELFNREQLILSKLSHPSVVAFHHSGVTTDGTHYLVMEYINDAENIIDYALKHKLSIQAIVSQIKKLCEVLSYAHEKQIIHRDIKPANILVDSAGLTKVIDFGIGRLEQLEGQTVTQVFTPDAAAPEQLLGHGVSAQTDVFSLGALLLQLLVKQKPLPKINFKNYDPQLDVKHINNLLKASDLDKDLKNIITTAMHIDPLLRYESMRAFADDLNNWMNHKPVRATADSLLYQGKKLFARNKGLSLLVTLGMLITVLAIALISTLESKNQKVTSQRDGSFALLEAMINQANPITNSEKNIDGDAMVKSLNELANSQAQLLETDTELSHFFYSKLGSLYHSKGLYDQSLTSYQTAFDSLKSMVVEDDDQFLSSELTIAHLFEATGQFKQAQSAAESILHKLDGLPNAAPKHRLNAYYLLSKVHQYQAQNETSYEYGQKALSWLNKHPNIDSELQASVFNSLAVTNRNMGNIDLSETQYNKAISLLSPIKEKQLELSGMIVNLAILKGRSGDMQASEKLFNDAFKIIKNIDEDHPHLAMAYLPYSTLLQFTDRLAESEQVIKTAINMLLKKGEEKHLAIAHMKYARIGLYIHNLDYTLEHVAKSYLIYKDITGEDHPVIFDLFNMALWVLLLDPYQEYGIQMVKTVTAKNVEAVISAPEYKRFLVQKALLEHLPIELDFAEAVFPNLIYGQSNQSNQSKLDWLAQMKEKYRGQSDVVDSWLDINKALINNDALSIQKLCESNQAWFESSRFAAKFLIVQKCLEKTDLLDSKTQSTFKQLIQSISNPNTHRKTLIQQLLTALKQ